jgi:hypothetical protein
MQTGLLSVRAGKLERLAAAAIGAGKPIKPDERFPIKRQFTEPPGPKMPTRAELLMDHTRQVEKSLVCEDFPEKVYANSCEAKLASDPELCTVRKAEILFQCPKTCRYCAKEDGRFCEDFYLNKCEFYPCLLHAFLFVFTGFATSGAQNENLIAAAADDLTQLSCVCLCCLQV